MMMLTRACGIVMILLAACGPETLLERNFDSQCWSASDTLSVYLPDPGVDFFAVEVTFGAEYPYRNVFIRAAWPSGILTLADTLLDADGAWLIPLQGDRAVWTSPPQPARGSSLKVFHYMRDSLLCEVRKVRVLEVDPPL